MRKIYLLLMIVLLVFSLGVAGQPTVFYTNLTSTTNPTLINAQLGLVDLGAFGKRGGATTTVPAIQTHAFLRANAITKESFFHK